MSAQEHVATVTAPRAELTLAQALGMLVKPRITAMVGFAAFVGGLLASGSGANLLRLVEASAWIGLVGMSSSVFNQILERDTDARMHRTAQRPLVTGRLRVRDAIWGGALLAVAGVLGLALRFNTLAALLTLATMVAYVLVYTPLKRVSSLNTAVGAIPGAMPPLLGYVAVAGAAGGWGWYLFAILFAWQFPHFLAIAWIYREDYARAGLKMLPAMPRTEGMAGRQALLYSLALLPISLLPALSGAAGLFYVVVALVLGLAYIAASAAFALRESRGRARAVVLVSLLYVPALYSLTLMDPLVRALGARGSL